MWIDISMLSLSDSEKKWQRSARKLNVENAREGLPNMNSIEGPTILVGSSITDKIIKNMKVKKEPGLSGVTADMLKISGSLFTA